MTDINLLEHKPIAWTPTPDVIERAQLTKFMRQVGVSTWDELYQFSIRDVEKFTEEVLKFLDIKFDPPYEKLLDTSDGIEFPKWFSRSDKRSEDTPVLNAVASTAYEKEGSPRSEAHEDKSVLAPAAGLNITTMCLDRWQTDGMKEQVALIVENEQGDVWEYEYDLLFKSVLECAQALQLLGLGKGDAIGIHLPMIVETVVALLAINRIGAIAVPVFSGYGVEAIASRMNAVKAKAIFACDVFTRRSKLVKAAETTIEAIKSVPTIKHLISVRNDLTVSTKLNEVKDRLDFEPFVAKGHNYLLRHPNARFAEPTSAEDPLIILYTSGTTGKPKGIAHTHASFPIKAAQDMAFGMDVGRGTRICWYTDLGWMMGPWLIYGALINGATICLYDGAPDYPTPDRMWEFCAKHKVEILGISPTLVRALASHEHRSEDTPVLNAVASTAYKKEGSPRSEARSEDTPVLNAVASTAYKKEGSPRSEAHEDKSVLAPMRKGWSRRGNLPHYDGEVMQFITFRLADSIPYDFIGRLKLELEREKSDDAAESLRHKIEEYLDRGEGECILKRADVADIVMTTILDENGQSCDLKAWVIMPNHVHLLLHMLQGHDLGNLMKRIKGISSRRINELLGRSGKVWQADYFDRYIRDAEHFSKVYRYIENNPVAAGLVTAREDWKFGSAYKSEDRSEDTPVLNAVASTACTQSASPRSEAHEDKSVLAPIQRHDLSSLRAFGSTGEPWNPGPWWWLFEKVGNSKLPIINYSGGTEIAGGILMGNPLLPIKPCGFPAPCPGMDVDIVDENGKSVGPNQVGELVIRQPWIGMARGFWKEKERYLETYWSRFKNIWVHGDWAMRDDDGHWFILGRSDDTLKVAGKRVGPAEVESILVSHPSVAEAAVIGVPDETKGTAMVAFCVLRSEDTLVLNAVAPTAYQKEVSPRSEARSEDTLVLNAVAPTAYEKEVSPRSEAHEDRSVLAPFEAELKALVARDMGKPLAPSKIHFVSALPKTRNAKVMRRVLRAAYLSEDPGDLSSLENPQAVDEISKLRG